METFTHKPTLSPELNRQPRVLSAKFGDGYAQEAADGINNNQETWSLVFNGIDDTTAAAIDAFLSARAGYDPFYWTPPGGTQKTYKCKVWKRTYIEPDINHVSATFNQVFDL